MGPETILPHCRPNSRQTTAAEPELRTWKQTCEPSQQTCRTQAGISTPKTDRSIYIDWKKVHTSTLHCAADIQTHLGSSVWTCAVEVSLQYLYMFNCVGEPKYGLSGYWESERISFNQAYQSHGQHMRRQKHLNSIMAGKKDTCCIYHRTVQNMEIVFIWPQLFL